MATTESSIPAARVTKDGGESTSFLDKKSSHWCETALEWLARSNRVQQEAIIPTDPNSAARHFCHNLSTGIPSMDQQLENVWMKKNQQQRAITSTSITPGRGSSTPPTPTLPILELYGKVSCHTMTNILISLAARFVVATRPSRFPTTSDASLTILPKVIVIDSMLHFHDTTITSLMTAIRTALLRELPHDAPPEEVQSCLYECMSRIHIVSDSTSSSSTFTTTVAALEALLQLQQQSQNCWNLYLYDSFLTTISDSTAKMEVRKQVTRLWRSSSAGLVVLSSGRTYPDGNMTKHCTSLLVRE